jgi:transitional endoplasmic reticulum ATPase
MTEHKMLMGHTSEILQRKLEDFIARAAKRFGDMHGKVEFSLRPDVSFGDIGGLARAKEEMKGLVFTLKSPDLHRKWGTQPPSGILLFGPPGTGKTWLAMALAREAEAVFIHVNVRHVVAKWYGDSLDVFLEVFAQAKESGRCVLFLDEIDELVFDRAVPEEMRVASRRLVNAVGEQLDEIGPSGDILAVASTNRPDALDATLVGQGRLERLIEVPLPESDEKQEIMRIHTIRAETTAGRKLFGPLDLDSVLARTVKMSAADLARIVRRALETKAHREGAGQQPGSVTTEDMQQAIEDYRRTKDVIEKIRYGQYL